MCVCVSDSSLTCQTFPYNHAVLGWPFSTSSRWIPYFHIFITLFIDGVSHFFCGNSFMNLAQNITTLKNMYYNNKSSLYLRTYACCILSGYVGRHLGRHFEKIKTLQDAKLASLRF